LQYPVLFFLGRTAIDIRLSAVAATVILFLLPALVMGAVTPLALRLALSDMQRTGEVAGRLYAVSTLGSIFGTFMAGFLLFALLGTNMIVFGVGLTLLTCSLLAAARDLWPIKLLGLLVIGGLIAADRLWQQELAKVGMREFDTAYQRVGVSDGEDLTLGRMTRRLITDPFGTQSVMLKDAPFELAAQYSQFYDLAFVFNPSLRRALMLGGGAYVYPRYFINRYESLTLDVIEIDEGLTRIARQFFQLTENPRLRIIHEDGRVYLNRQGDTYDAIFLDAFNAPPSIPFQLTTIEAVRLVHSRLNDNGVVISNIVSGVEGPEGDFLRSEIATFEAVFPELHLYQVDPTRDRRAPQNLILIGVKSVSAERRTSSDPRISSLLEREIDLRGVVRDMRVLTDNFAPVEELLLATAKRMETQRRGLSPG